MTGTDHSGISGDLVHQLAVPGSSWTWAYVDVSGDREDPQRLASLQRRSIRDRLGDAGAPAAAIDLIETELAEAPGVPAPVSRFCLVRDETLVVSDILPGHMHGPESIGWGPVPDLVPLVAHRPLDLPFLVVEVGRAGGGYRAYQLGHAEPVHEETVEGRTDTLHKFKGGGWSQTPWQHHTEEIWKENETEVAAVIDEAVLRLRPKLIVVAGDVRARRLLIDALSVEARSVVSEAPVDPRAPDASDASLVEHVEIALARVIAQRRHDVEDLLNTHVGRGDLEAVTGVGPAVDALQQAQVATLVLDTVALEDRPLLALDASPWIATAPEQASGANIVGDVDGAVGLVRAGVLTNAEVVLANAASLPNGAPVAAVLRWPVGPH